MVFTIIRESRKQRNMIPKVTNSASFDAMKVFTESINNIEELNCLLDRERRLEESLDNSVYVFKASAMEDMAISELSPLPEEKRSPKHYHYGTENINIWATNIHAWGDFVQSVGVCIAGTLIWYEPRWRAVDSSTTLLFSILVLYTTIGVVQRNIEGINPSEMKKTTFAPCLMSSQRTMYKFGT